MQTLLQGVHIREDSDNLPVAVKRQTTAFPPNFVHSLDSTHMMMTAIEMDKVGVPFAAVHDSYWVHAGNVDVMNDKLRQVPWLVGWLCVSGVVQLAEKQTCLPFAEKDGVCPEMKESLYPIVLSTRPLVSV